MKPAALLWGLCGIAVAGLAQAQPNFDGQPITNLQDGISPRVAATRRQQDEKTAAAAQLDKSANEQTVAIRARLAEHDCTGARNLATQDRDPSLSADVEALCAPPVNSSIPLSPQGPQ